MSHQKLFFQQFFEDFIHVGAILPSSRYLGRAVVSYLAQKQGQVRVLEAGAGTGPFTREILPLLQPDDILDAVELNSKLIDTLEQRFKQEPEFQTQDGVKVNLIADDVRNVAKDYQYDFIVFSLPLTNFPPSLVQEILDLMMGQLKPSGVFSYVHYIFISRLKYVFSSAAVRAEIKANKEIITSFADQYQIERRAVLRNVPPSWAYFWQKPADD